MFTTCQAVGCLFLAACITMAAHPADKAEAAVIASENKSWQPKEYADHDCMTIPLTLKGPGTLTIRLKMTPYQKRMFATSSEDIVTHGLPDFARWLGTTYNGANYNGPTEGLLGKPQDRIERWEIKGGTYRTDLRFCNPVKCNFAGACYQYGASANLVVDFTPGTPGSVSATQPPTLPEKPTGQSKLPDSCWTGAWKSNFGTLSLTRQGNTVQGTYSRENGKLTGTIIGNKLKGQWSEMPTYSPPNDAGEFELEISRDCASFSGSWRYGKGGSAWNGKWSATQTSSKPAVSTGAGSPSGTTGKTGSTGKSGRHANHALASGGAVASQSSTYVGSCPAGPEKAIDGITDAGIAHGCSTQIAHTNSENRPWWRVDLGREKTVAKIVIWNRNDVAKERLTNFTVTARDSNGNVVFSKSFFTSGGHPDPSFTIPLSNIRARQIQVQLNGRDYLNIAEVQVFGPE